MEKGIDTNPIGRKVRQLRKLRGFTQEYIAIRMGLSIRGYSKIELGETKLSVNRLFELADILDLTVHEILMVEVNLDDSNHLVSQESRERMEELKALIEKKLEQESD